MQLTYLEAIRQGIWEEMDRDSLPLLPARAKKSQATRGRRCILSKE